MNRFFIGGIHQNHKIQNLFEPQDLKSISKQFGQIGVVGLTVRQNMANQRDPENAEGPLTNQRARIRRAWD